MYRGYQNDKIVYNLLDDKINKFLYKFFSHTFQDIYLQSDIL